MPAVTRVGDSSSGHGGFPPTTASSGSPNVLVNGKPVHRVGDSWVVHCDPTPVCHGPVLAGGSGTVMINGKPCGRVGDPMNCGDTVAAGSGNVYAG